LEKAVEGASEEQSSGGDGEGKSSRTRATHTRDTIRATVAVNLIANPKRDLTIIVDGVFLMMLLLTL
jgi:hypothetical protein